VGGASSSGVGRSGIERDTASQVCDPGGYIRHPDEPPEWWRLTSAV
jgi:hypothetical protein